MPEARTSATALRMTACASGGILALAAALI
jgi:hypothetical protein